MKANEIKKKDLKNAERAGFSEVLPLLDEIYIIPTKRRHDSGYTVMEVVGIVRDKDNNVTYMKKVDCVADVISYMEWGTFLSRPDLHMDIDPVIGYPHIWSNQYKIKVDANVSSFMFRLVYDK